MVEMILGKTPDEFITRVHGFDSDVPELIT